MHWDAQLLRKHPPTPCRPHSAISTLPNNMDHIRKQSLRNQTYMCSTRGKKLLNCYFGWHDAMSMYEYEVTQNSFQSNLFGHIDIKLAVWQPPSPPNKWQVSPNKSGWCWGKSSANDSNVYLSQGGRLSGWLVWIIFRWTRKYPCFCLSHSDFAFQNGLSPAPFPPNIPLKSTSSRHKFLHKMQGGGWGHWPTLDMKSKTRK